MRPIFIRRTLFTVLIVTLIFSPLISNPRIPVSARASSDLSAQTPDRPLAEICGGVFAASVDATISQEYPTTPLGSGPRLQVSQVLPEQQYSALFDFDLSSVPGGVTIHQARLELEVTGTSYTREDTFQAFTILEAWDEAAVQWDNQPALQVNRRSANASYVGGILSVDVTTLVQSWLARPGNSYGLALLPAAGGVDVGFHSRESTTGGVSGPRLVIRCAAGREPLARDSAPGDAAQLADLERLYNGSSQPLRITLERGVVRSATLNLELPAVSGNNAAEKALYFVENYADLFRFAEPESDLQYARASADGEWVSFRQRHQGIPVQGAYVMLHVPGQNVRYVGGNYLASIERSADPRLSAEAAEAIALEVAGSSAEVAGDTQLRYLNLGLFDDREDETYLAWLVSLDDQGATRTFFIDAETGLLLYEPAIDEDAFDLAIYDAAGMNHKVGCFDLITNSELWFTENGPNWPYANPDQEGYDAYAHIQAVYQFWLNTFGHDSIDDDGGKIFMFLNAGDESGQVLYNAYSKPGCLVFGDGHATLDIVGHEFTHAVEREFADLEYVYQSGALSESYADIFGHFVDPEDWLIGEDKPGGAWRSMAFPELYGDPSHMDDYVVKYYGDDFGGVHTNSGIPNKAAFLLTDGGGWGGYLVDGIGPAKARRLFYQMLTAGEGGSPTFIDGAKLAHYIAFDWSLTGKYGFTANDACQVLNAYAAVGIQPVGDSNCDGNLDGPDGDDDQDGIGDSSDNCPIVPNPKQQNSDDDGQGDACDFDDDNDAIIDLEDNCPLVMNSGQFDHNNNGIGDICEDVDGDLEVDYRDNCVWVFNYDQSDLDEDLIGDACDNDIDGDGVWQPPYTTPGDNCPWIANPTQEDADLDSIGDACDLCPAEHDPDNTDTDGDGTGNPCDDDDDNDGWVDWLDNCALTPNPDQADLNQNGLGYACDAEERAMVKAMIARVNQMVHIAPDLSFRVDLPIYTACESCGGGPIILHPGFEVTIDLNIGAGVYARVLDSQRNVVAHDVSDGAGRLQIDFEPSAFSFMPASGSVSSLSSWRSDLPNDRTGYTLEIIPLEDPNGDRTYELDLKIVQGFSIYLPFTVSTK